MHPARAARTGRQRGSQESGDALVAALCSALLGPAGSPPLPAAWRARLCWSRGAERRVMAAAAVAAFGRAVDACVSEGQVEAADEDRLLEFARKSGLAPADLDSGGALGRLGRAAARAEVLRGGLPLWCPSELRRPASAERAVWVFEDLELLRAPKRDPEGLRTDWWLGGRALRSALSRPLDRRGLRRLGRARLRLLGAGARLRAGSWRSGWTAAEPPAVELRADGVLLEGAFGRLALSCEEPWLLAEMLRLHAAAAPHRRPVGGPPA